MKLDTKRIFQRGLLFVCLGATTLLQTADVRAQHVMVNMCSGTPTGGLGTNLYGPMYSVATANATSRTAVIYPSSQLTALAGKTLTNLYFHRLTATGAMAGTPNYKIYVKEDTSTSFGSGALDWATATTGATLVYNGNPASIVGSTAGWKAFPFTANFAYSGTQNLLVYTEYTNATASTAIEWTYEYTSPCINTSNSNTTKYSNVTTGVLPATLASTNYRRPYIAFDTLQTPCGTVAAPTIALLTQNVCPGTAPAAITATGAFAFGGLSLQWEESDDDGVNDPWAAAVGGTGSTTPSYTAPAFADTIYYRLRVTCTASSSTAVSPSSAVFNTTGPATAASAITYTSSVNPTSGTINWTAGNGTRRYVVINTANSFTTPTNGTTAPTVAGTVYAGTGEQIVYDGTGTSVALTGLNCSTTYYVRVFEYNRCGTAAPFSHYFNTGTGTTNPASILTTQPAIATMPALNGFTGFTGANLTTLYPGWYEAAITQTAGSTPTQANPSGTTSSWTSSTVFTGTTTARVNLVAATKNEWIISPRINLTGSTAPRLTFRAAITTVGSATAYALGMGLDDKVNVLISTDGCGKVWTPIYSFDSVNTAGTLTNVLTDFALPLTPYIGQTIQVAFQATEGPIDNAPTYDFHIDSVRIEETPTCIAPTGFTSSAITSSGATISWTAAVPAPADGYQYYVGTSATPPTGAPTGSVAAGVTTINLTGLSGNTAYYVWVRSDCGSGVTSAWALVPAFTTPCAVYTSPFIQGFAGGTLPGCWTNSNPSGNTGATTLWKFTGAPDYGTTANGRPVGSYAWVDASTPYVADVTLTSPQINLAGLTNPYLEFEWYKNNTDAAPIPQVNNNLKVEGNPGGTGWVTLFNDTSNATVWRPVGIVLPPAFAGTIAQFRFVVDKTLSGDFYDDLLLDSVRVGNAPACAMPGIGVATGITPTGATLTWAAAALAPANGYQYEVRSSGAPGSGSTGLGASGPTAAGVTTATVNTLLPATTYTVYVRSNCGSSTGLWVTGLTFTTPVSCGTPNALTATGLTPMSANLGWTPQGFGSPTTWQISYGPTGTTAANGTKVIATANPYTLSGLAPATGHVFFVRSICAPGDTSAWSTSVAFTTPATCGTPNTLTATGLTTTSANLGWTPQGFGSPATWQISYGVTGTTAANGTKAIATANPYMLPGLTPATGYVFFVRSICAPGDTSAWSASLAFTTPCVPSSLPFMENFATVPPACWTRGQAYQTATPTALTTATTSWGLDQYLNNSANGPSARINNFVSSKRDWLVTPSIDLGTAPSNFVLEFNLGIIAYSASTTLTNPVGVALHTDDTVAVVVSTDNGATWTSANALRVWTAANTPLNAAGHNRFYLPMNGYSGLIKIGFYSSEGSTSAGTGNPGDNDIFVDSVHLTECFAPTASLGNDTTLCTAGATVTLNAGTGTGYTWSTGATTQTIAVSTPGTYSVMVYNGNLGCAKSDTIVVSTGITPVVNLGPNTPVPICGNITSSQLNAGNPGSNYVWMGNPSINTQTLDIAPYINNINQNPGVSTPTVNTQIGVVVTNASGCTGGDTLDLVVTLTPRASSIAVTGTSPTYSFTPVADSFATTYTYDFGDGATATGSAATHTYTTSGTYTVNLVLSNSCGTDTVTTTVTVTATGIDDVLAGGSLRLFPNPTTANATLEVEGGQKLRGVQVLSATGALVASHTLNDGATHTTLNTASFAPGIYTLRIQLDKGVVVRKLEVIK